MKIRYYGHAGQLTGYGKAAEGMCMSLLSVGAELEIRPLAPYHTIKLDLPLASCVKKDHELDPHPDVVIVHTLPMDCPKVMAITTEAAGAVRPGVLDLEHPRPKWVAYTTWEGCTRAPESMVAPYCQSFDEVWHPSEASAWPFGQAINVLCDTFNETQAPYVRVVPHAFDEDKFVHYRTRIDATKLAVGDPDLYRFYFIGAWGPRKNLVGLIRAFAHAFTRADPVELLIASQGLTADMLTHAICSTGLTPDVLPPIRSDFKTATDEEIWWLHRGADCFVTASRGEAWNLPLFEAALAGRHLICPDRGGHVDYLRTNTSSVRFVRTTESPAMVETRVEREGNRTTIQTVGAQGLTAKSAWLEPDLIDLAAAMLEAFTHRRRELTLGYPLKERFGYRAVGHLAMNYLETLLRKDPA